MCELIITVIVSLNMLISLSYFYCYDAIRIQIQFNRNSQITWIPFCFDVYFCFTPGHGNFNAMGCRFIVYQACQKGNETVAG